MTERPDKESALRALRGFQRSTVAHVVERLRDPSGSRRFLVADEVGLGKTLVARGVVAEFIDEHWDSVDRIDIVYLCSNSALARENLRKIRVGGDTVGKEIPATRFTLLPRLTKDFHPRLNFVSLTPGTAMRTGGTGQKEERLVLYHLLREAFDDGAWLGNLLRGTVGVDRWRSQVREPLELDRTLTKRFLKALSGNGGLKRRVRAMASVFARVDSVEARERSIDAYHLVGELRNLLARVCIDAVEPDLIILDEFQRFKDLLVTDDSEVSPEAELARQLFGYKTPQGNDVALLLLSATPYRMFTTDQEIGSEDHYEDFLETVRFLLNDDTKLAHLKTSLERYREHLTRASTGAAHDLPSIKRELESQLLGVMCRRERVGSTVDRDGMIIEPRRTTSVAATDIAQYLALERVREQIDAYDLVELWKSAPYVLNFAKGYQFKTELERRAGTAALRDAFAKGEGAHLTEATIASYEAVDPGSGRLRLLAQEAIDGDRWKMLWVPPSLPYWPLGEPWATNRDFTKKLLFSSWNVVPDAVSALLSYEVERRMAAEAARRRGIAYHDYYRRRPELLRFTVRDGQAAAMTTLALQLPCLALADIHPLELEGDVREAMSVRVREALGKLAERQASERIDTKWYWAALLLLERDSDEVIAFLHRLAEGDAHVHAGADADASDEGEDEPEDDSHAESRRRGRKGLRVHVERALAVLEGRMTLGAFPDDLADVITDFALGGPAVLWARTLEGFGVSRAARRDLAAQLADAVRSLFNEPPVIEMLHDGEEGSYWRRTLRYAIDGNLQAVLDEHAHLLWEPEAWSGEGPDAIAEGVTAAATSAMTTKTSRIRPDYFELRPRSVGIRKDGTAVRTHFALRYSTVRSGSEASDIREDAVRDAFRSPFYPFVLASTSVGQEGLDFHPWCHSVWHWNLPGNPVDLEQREGRVHRYKGHAVRKNVAAAHGAALRARWQRGSDPWAVLFDLAEEEARTAGASELVPCWLAPGPHKVERCVPMLPFSRETAQLAQLKRSLAIYRVVFGQPRQEELVTLLARADVVSDELDAWVLRLEPPAVKSEAAPVLAASTVQGTSEETAAAEMTDIAAVPLPTPAALESLALVTEKLAGPLGRVQRASESPATSSDVGSSS